MVVRLRRATLLDRANDKASKVRRELEKRGDEHEQAQVKVRDEMTEYIDSHEYDWFNEDANFFAAMRRLDEIDDAALSERLVSDVDVRRIGEALAESTVVSGKPCELISGQPKSAAMGLYHFMRVRDPFAEEGTQKLEKEIADFIASLKEHAAKVKQHTVLVTLLKTVGSEGEALIEEITGDVRASIAEIDYFKKIAWLKPDATPAKVVEVVEEELLGNLRYILYEECSEKYVVGPNATRDKGRGKQQFSDFMVHPNVKDAELTASHVCALRLYTTLAFKYINSPLRNQDVYYKQNKAHPLPVTVAYVAEGIKKLRAAYAVKVAKNEATPVTALWRGMKNLTMGDDFMSTAENGKCKGGTELAPMSTTTDLAVAARYASSGDSLLFKISLDNFMQYGAELKWLSAFPGEEEVLYPPLTILPATDGQASADYMRRERPQVHGV